MLKPRFDAFEDGYRLAIAIDPDAAGSALLADAEFHFCAIHAQDRMIPLGHRLGLAHDVVANQGAAKAIGAQIGVAAVHQLPVEKSTSPGSMTSGIGS